MREFLATPFFLIAKAMLFICANLMDEDYTLIAHKGDDDEEWEE